MFFAEFEDSWRIGRAHCTSKVKGKKKGIGNTKRKNREEHKPTAKGKGKEKRKMERNMEL